MDSMDMRPLEDELPTVRVDFASNDWEGFALIPWFSFRVNLPERPLPPYASRPPIRTKRLIIRPILMSDLEAFHELRRREETQVHSTERGRPDRDIEETRRFIERLHAGEEAGCENWYFGAFLATTPAPPAGAEGGAGGAAPDEKAKAAAAAAAAVGADAADNGGEMIGEGGMPDLVNTRAGWPESEILLKKEYWRQGYGMEFWEAFANSWWALPRRIRRHQLMPAIVPHKEPGDSVIEGIGVTFESTNDAARAFFAKVLGDNKMQLEGSLETFDMREGRTGQLVTWAGGLIANPHAILSRTPSRTSSRGLSQEPASES